MTEKLLCERMVKIDDGRDWQGNPVHHHERCNLPASVVELSGMLAKATAILCTKHKAQAEHQPYVSSNGFPKGKISKSAKKQGYHQTPFKLTST